METKEVTAIKKPLRQKIGVATLVNDKDGQLIEAMFDPIIKIKDCTDLVTALKQISSDNVAKQAQLVFGAWFAKLEDVQLGDREKYKVKMQNVGTVDMPATYPKNTYPEGSRGTKYLFTFEEL